MNFYKKSFAVFSCLLVQQWFFITPVFSSDEKLAVDAVQTAEIIGIRQEAEQIASLLQYGALSAGERHKLNTTKAFVLRRVFEAVLQVHAAENRLDMELAYAYDVMAREQRKTNTVNQLFNVVNFAQLSTLYGFFEPYSRLHDQFKQSSIGTSVGSGLAIGLPVLNIIYNKFAKASHLSPPTFLSNVLDGKPVDGSNLPPLVVRHHQAAKQPNNDAI